MDYPFFVTNQSKLLCETKDTAMSCCFDFEQQIETTIEKELSLMETHNGFGKMHKIDISCIYSTIECYVCAYCTSNWRWCHQKTIRILKTKWTQKQTQKGEQSKGLKLQGNE